MPERISYDYAVVRVVPRVEREEFLNAGVILFARERGALLARTALDEARLAALAPGLDPAPIGEHLDSIELVCAGGEAAGPHQHLSASERFHWLTAPRSTVLQVSAVHSGLCDDPKEEVDRLFELLVTPG